MTAKFGTFGPACVSLLCASIAAACPICQTETGQQVRSGIFGADFWSNMILVLLPFPIFLLIALALHYGFGRGTPSAKGAGPNEPKPDDNANDNTGGEQDHGR